MRALLPVIVAILMLGKTAVAQSPAALPAAASCLQAGETADQWQTVEICTKAIGADRPLRPGLGSAYFARGRALALMGEREKSLADLDIAIVLGAPLSRLIRIRPYAVRRQRTRPRLQRAGDFRTMQRCGFSLSFCWRWFFCLLAKPPPRTWPNSVDAAPPLKASIRRRERKLAISCWG